MNKIIEIINGIKPGYEIGEKTDLFGQHILDSLSMITLVSELDDEFDVEITAKDIVPTNFATVACIEKMIERLDNED